MCKPVTTLALLFSVILAGHTQSTVSFAPTWKFITGDHPDYKNSNFNDAAWKTIQVPAHWEDQGYPGYDGVGWYRTQFDLPANATDKSYVLLAGIIDDADETYINGVLIGTTGKFPPNDQSAWDTQRKYNIPKGVLKAHNTLAVRVFDGTGGGGIYGGRIELITLQQYEKERQKLLKNQQSWPYLTTSNGLIAAVYNAASNKVEAVYPHIFSSYDSAQLVLPFILNIAPKGNEQPQSVHYLRNTHVIEVRYAHYTIFYTAAFSTSETIFYAVVRGKKADIDLVSFANEQPNRSVEINTVTKQFGGQTEKYVLFGFTDAFHARSGVQEAVNRIQNCTHSLIDDELGFMQKVFDRCHFPAGLSRKERALMEQSVSTLKMAQVADNEVFPKSRGQIIASLRPGVWSIAWVRDGAFAIEALAKIGLYEEARKGLQFILEAAPANQYKHFMYTDGKDYGIGVDYQISVTRYFGNGREESDFNERGPNIEIDDFGLFLSCLSDYVNASHDTAFFKTWQPVLQTKVADAIIHNINNQNIIRADSGPWEHHLPGRSFVFTSGVCSVGLEKFAALQAQLGYNAAPYTAAAQRLYNGVMTNMLYESRLIKGNANDLLPTDHYFYDGATFELFANGFIHDKNLFLSHMAAYEKELGIAGKGYKRFNSADTYENQEWPFASLRVAVAQTTFGNKKEAKKLVGRITNIASRNYNAIPEIIAIEDAAYKGSVPMVGYGAGAYLISMLKIHE